MALRNGGEFFFLLPIDVDFELLVRSECEGVDEGIDIYKGI